MCSVFVVNSSSSLYKAQEYFKKQERGIIFMADEFKIGADVKCKRDASVMAYVPEDDRFDPDREEVL